MAHVEKIEGKRGISYRIIVSDGVDLNGKRIVHKKTWKPPPGMKQREIKSALNAEVVAFEKAVALGYNVEDKYTFSEYAEYAIKQKERSGKKHRTTNGYKALLPRINQAIGHKQLDKIRTVDLNKFYENLEEEGIRQSSARAVPRVDLRAALKGKNLSMAKTAKLAGIAESTVNSAAKGKPILAEKAELIAEIAGIPFETLFELKEDNRPLSSTTIWAYHRFIHTVLELAKKEKLIANNPADDVTLPKKEKSKVDTYQTDELIKIRDAAEQEPVKWKTAIHLLMITGCRRGEVVGMQWSRVDWKESSILIDTNLQYTPERGVYVETIKNEETRTIKLPAETMALLREYKVWQLETRLACGDRWIQSDYIFTGEFGGHMAPDTLSGYLQRFEEKYDLPHIHAHRFRHSMASILYFSGADVVSISKRLGHAQVSTTQDMYAHLIKQADTQSAERIADAIFRSNQKSG